MLFLFCFISSFVAASSFVDHSKVLDIFEHLVSPSNNKSWPENYIQKRTEIKKLLTTIPLSGLGDSEGRLGYLELLMKKYPMDLLPGLIKLSLHLQINKSVGWNNANPQQIIQGTFGANSLVQLVQTLRCYHQIYILNNNNLSPAENIIYQAFETKFYHQIRNQISKEGEFKQFLLKKMQGLLWTDKFIDFSFSVYEKEMKSLAEKYGVVLKYNSFPDSAEHPKDSKTNFGLMIDLFALMIYSHQTFFSNSIPASAFFKKIFNPMIKEGEGNVKINRRLDIIESEYTNIFQFKSEETFYIWFGLYHYFQKLRYLYFHLEPQCEETLLRIEKLFSKFITDLDEHQQEWNRRKEFLFSTTLNRTFMLENLEGLSYQPPESSNQKFLPIQEVKVYYFPPPNNLDEVDFLVYFTKKPNTMHCVFHAQRKDKAILTKELFDIALHKLYQHPGDVLLLADISNILNSLF